MNRAQRPTVDDIEKELARRDTIRKYRNATVITLGIIVVVSAIAVIVATLLLPVLRVSGSSMSPVIKDNDIVCTVKKSELERGDIAAFYYNNKILIKRVIAGEGDIVVFNKKGEGFVNDDKLDEPYAVDVGEGDCDIDFPFQVPEDSWFVMGDHRSSSIDSRTKQVGCIKNEDMIGKVVLRVYPFKRISFIK